MSECQLLIDYKGVISFEVIGQLLNLLKQKMDFAGERVNTYKRILTVMVETLENICKYSESYPEFSDIIRKYPQVCQLEHCPGVYKLKVKNPVHLNHIEEMKKKIDQVNNLDPIKLKELYRQTIANGQFSRVGGAGLGFIEMVKACGNPIHYEFEPIDNSYTYFSIVLELTN